MKLSVISVHVKKLYNSPIFPENDYWIYGYMKDPFSSSVFMGC